MRRHPSFLIVVALAILLAGCGGANRNAATPPTTPRANHRKPLSFTQLVAKVKTGIVRIETVTCNGQFVGTGFLLSPRLVATVEHVVDGAFVITLKQNGKTVGNGTVIGADAARDVALVESNRPIAGYRFRISARAPQLGESVTAIGFPLGLPLSVTSGAVSGLDRTIPIEGISRHQMVQTDTPLNPGNSGGPLITNTGQVVGLVDAGITQASGLGFAVSARVAAPLLAAWRAAPQAIPSPNCQPPAQAAAPTATTSTTSSAQTPLYTSNNFSIDYPAGWVISHINEGPNLDTTFTDPDSSAYVMRVDENPKANVGSAAAAAAPVIAALRRQPSYEELDISDITFEGMDALRWEFEDTENGVRLHKVDLFFIDPNGHGWGILTQAPQAAWSQDSTPFSEYVQTFQDIG